MQDKLGEYRRKRNFGTTSEPRDGGEKRSREERDPRFVIQKHDASSLHYDFRLEVDGVLKSWAVPKGPSIDPQDKRLAVPTEDHPLEYADFEGVIPAEEYGAGTVLVWDTGTYRHLSTHHDDAAEALEQGRLSVWLEGQKLRGGYALTRMGRNGQWLLVKMKDEGADRRRKPLKRQPRSVLSGGDLADITETGGQLR
ncbi:DNA ligase D-like protein (predicted 3'-phosphoesterase) [Saccharopolyspora lacisalsi]|uniref:DNA ligase D-like protein (Predicted 3'-phosphoesterase) n=1 Tax=Halosaccharopolyspora lacisalsi TaxID=1000566 RepID=A0A839DSK0_9PSEU|nr:DNA polymerase ligase N-terminal domain-containing protein [Halosaccharopolyspora lacisalsi]MBA8824484.1 DNA ligase D-like protein (predicted 3'-phosphoesterase) [Halosaccharopolyspora lacisalsi]